jgi:hypothetical protein
MIWSIRAVVMLPALLCAAAVALLTRELAWPLWASVVSAIGAAWGGTMLAGLLARRLTRRSDW